MAAYCKNKLAKCLTCHRKVTRWGTTCNTCQVRRWRTANPVAYSYQSLRNNAKRRGKVFTISLEYFVQFCYQTDYIRGKGRSATSYTVDRIDEQLGYVEGNIACRQNGDNVRKYLAYDYERKTATVVTVESIKTEILNVHNNPF